MIGSSVLDVNENLNTVTPSTQKLGLALNHAGTRATGYALLVGGATNKEFCMTANADTTANAVNLNNDIRVVAMTTPSRERPIVATCNTAVKHKGDSVVQYHCGWVPEVGGTVSDPAAADATGGIGIPNNQGGNRCRQTSLLGLTVIPVKSSAGIKPGDFLRVDYPRPQEVDFTDNNPAEAFTVTELEEEIYRVNAVHGNDVIVTHKPLAHTSVANVNRYGGGTNLDLLSYTGTTVEYTMTTASSASAGFDASVSPTSVSVAVGYYCLIEKEFMYISGVSANVLTFVAQPSTTSNKGREAFGTKGITHPTTGSCHLYQYMGGLGQGTSATSPGFGFTTIHDARVSIRQLSSVDSSTQISLGAKASGLVKTGSEPTAVIGDPYEDFAGCAGMGAALLQQDGTTACLVNDGANIAAGVTTITLDSTANVV